VDEGDGAPDRRIAESGEPAAFARRQCADIAPDSLGKESLGQLADGLGRILAEAVDGELE
jgi:hypothetical protein